MSRGLLEQMGVGSRSGFAVACTGTCMVGGVEFCVDSSLGYHLSKFLVLHLLFLDICLFLPQVF
jgi:hypothetical protein